MAAICSAAGLPSDAGQPIAAPKMATGAKDSSASMMSKQPSPRDRVSANLEGEVVVLMLSVLGVMGVMGGLDFNAGLIA